MDKNFFWLFIGIAFILIILDVGLRSYIAILIVIILIVVGIVVAVCGKGTLKYPFKK